MELIFGAQTNTSEGAHRLGFYQSNNYLLEPLKIKRLFVLDFKEKGSEEMSRAVSNGSREPPCILCHPSAVAYLIQTERNKKYANC